MLSYLDGLANEIEQQTPLRHVGRVDAVKDSVILIKGLVGIARIGDRITVPRSTGNTLVGEVIRIERPHIHLLPNAAPDAVSVGDKAVLQRMPGFAPSDSWIGRVIDPYGAPLDGAPLLPGRQVADLHAAAPNATDRQPLGSRLDTGSCVLNTVLPIVVGQRIGLFAGSGVGKSRLLADLARHMEADLVVIALIGERGREVNEFVKRVLGPDGMRRAVVVAATSDQSALTRRRCAWAAMCVAEYFRESGRSVLFLADSITRFAEAHREVSVAAGEAPALRGFPPSTVPMITSLCERAGPGAAHQGHITAIFSVLVAGSDMDEPVADILRGVLDGHIVLDRQIAERGRFPAIDVLKSVSRSLPDAASGSENEMISDVRKLLGIYEQSEIMIQSGLYTEGTDPVLDRAIRIWPDLDEFFAKPERQGPENSFDRLGLILRRASSGMDQRKP